PVGAVVRSEVLPRQPETPATVASAPAPAARTYVVRAGDSLIKIARTVYGAGHEREYKRIYEANRNLMPDEATVIVGQELTIPPLPGAAPTPAPVRPATTVAEAPRHYREVTLETAARELADSTARRPAPQRTYTIRRGDNLTKIARETLGDDSRQAIQKLYNANKDKLRSPDSLPVGVTLEIPLQS
ncbi:MAG TPA: LysM peptidoglycan-binding domain-containing protein, partial [Phycisphaerae bacterium]|nr:LysM peptidoglycan-binding domain-containing protein [Phycisphaerae bacterium]